MSDFNIFLSIIQGIAECFPVSSSMHVILFCKIFDKMDHAFITHTLNLGTSLAIFFYFRQKALFLLKLFFTKYIVFKNLTLSVVPVGIAGIIFTIFITHFISTDFAIYATIMSAILLYFADKSPITQKSPYFSTKSCIILGFSQILSIIPGVSHLGISITTLRFLGYSRHEAIQFSMIIAIPLTLGASLINLPQNLDYCLQLNIISFITSLITLKILFFLINVKKITMTPFVIYRLLFIIFFIILTKY